MLVTKKQIIELLGISTNTLTAYLNEGMPGRVGISRGTKYNWNDVRDFHIARVVAQSIRKRKKDGGAVDLDGIPENEVSERISAHWKAEREKYRAREDSKRWITLDAAEKFFDRRVTRFRNVIDAFPGSVAAEAVMVTELGEAQRMLTRHSEKLLTALLEQPEDPIEAPAAIEMDNDDTDE